MRTLAIVLLAIGAAACAQQLTPQSLVSDMRVLAIRAEPASAAPGDTVHLDALLVDPFGAERPIARFWAACLNPPADNPARCLQGTAPLFLGDGEEVDAQIPDDALTGRERGVLGVLLYVCAGGTLAVGETGATCTGEGAAEIAAVKRVLIGEDLDNTNPVIEEVRLDGEPLAEGAMPTFASCTGGSCGAHTFALVAAEGAAETFQADGEARTEELVSSFAATSGAMEVPFGFGATTEVDWTPPDATGLVLFWLALRDDRGGVTWTERQALVQ